MRSNHVLPLLLLATLACGNAAAQQVNTARGFYAAVDFGQARLDRHQQPATSFDDHSSAYAVRFGYRFNRHIAMETGYTDFGHFSGEFRSACSPPPAACTPNTSETSINGWLFSFVTLWPLASHFQLTASAGGMYQKLDAHFQDVGQPPSDFSLDGMVLKVGFGVGVPVNDRFELSLDYNVYRVLAPDFFDDEFTQSVDGDSHVLTLGALLRF